MSKLRDTVMQRRAELLEELAECDAFLGLGYGQPFEPPMTPAQIGEGYEGQVVEHAAAIIREKTAPPRIPATTVIPQRTHGSSAEPPDDEAEQAAARNNNLDKMLTPGFSPMRVVTRPIVDENGKPTGGVERVPT